MQSGQIWISDNTQQGLLAISIDHKKTFLLLDFDSNLLSIFEKSPFEDAKRFK